MKVCKFGGSSLADAEQIRKVCGIVRADPDRRIVVVSAPGRRHKGDVKVTDLLIACAEVKLAGGDAADELRAVVERFRAIQEDLGLPGDITRSIESDLVSRLALSGEGRDAFLDRMKAAGEDNCAGLVAAALQQAGCGARYLSPLDAGFFLSAEHGNAVPLPEAMENLAALRGVEDIVVFPGFFGYTRDSAIVTFPRGGSDITGSVMAAAVGADLYENFTDVDAVFAADRNIVVDAVPIEELTYREMRELSYAGFGVIHDEAIVPAVRAGIRICIRNTNHPEAPGTTIVPERDYRSGEVVGIASDVGFCTIFVSKYLMNREVGFGRRLLQIFEEEGLSYEHTPSGIDNMSIILREDRLGADAEGHVLGRIRNELDTGNVEVERGLALIMIVGEGMRYAMGLAGKATKALADAGVNIEMLNQGSSEISLMFGVKAVDCERAVQSLYAAFFPPSTGKSGAGSPGGQA